MSRILYQLMAALILGVIIFILCIVITSVAQDYLFHRDREVMAPLEARLFRLYDTHLVFSGQQGYSEVVEYDCGGSEPVYSSRWSADPFRDEMLPPSLNCKKVRSLREPK